MDELLTRTYKRSQIEQVIDMLEYQLRGGQVSPALRSRLKRLLDADRGSVSEADFRNGSRCAFSDQWRPGHGAEVGYSAYHVFALLTGVRLLQGGITEGRTVALLQRTRSELEEAFRRIAAVPRQQLQRDTANKNDPNDKGITALEAERRVREGVIVGDPQKMLFFVELAGDGGVSDLSEADGDGAVQNICNHDQLLWRLRYVSHIGRAVIVLELTNAVHQLLYFLPHTTVRKRGRK